MTEMPILSAREQAYRRRRAVVPHRRRSLFVTLLRPFVGALLLVAPPLVGTWWLMSSPRFQFRELRVEGTSRVPDVWIDRTLEPLRGQQLLLISLQDVEGKLQAHPWVAAAEIGKVLPNQLRVRIEERRPAAVLQSAAGGVLIDQEGRPIDRLGVQEAADGLVQVRGTDPAPRDSAAAIRVVKSLRLMRPEWMTEFGAIEILGEGDFRLLTKAVPFPLLVSEQRLEGGIKSLTPFLPELVRRYPDAIFVDVRFSKQIVIQPANQGPLQAAWVTESLRQEG